MDHQGYVPRQITGELFHIAAANTQDGAAEVRIQLCLWQS
jgi:hypothetical protein